MPLTPIHCSVAYLINRWKPQLSLPALLVSTMVPDLENLFIYLITGGLYDRLVLHSFLGAATLGTCLSVMLTVYLYPPAVSFFFKFNRGKVKEKCRFSGTLVAVCFVGSVSHVLVDSLHHRFNPVLYPLVNESFDGFRITSNSIFDGALVTLVLLAVLVFFVVDHKRNGNKPFWMRMLVG